MTIIYCKKPNCKRYFNTPKDLQDHILDDHNPEADLLKELGVEWVDELPPRIAKGFDLDTRILALLEKQPGSYMRVWTSNNDKEASTRANKVYRLRKLYPQLDIRMGRVLNSWGIFCCWKVK